MGCWCFCNKELRPVGIRAGVGHRESARSIKGEARDDLVIELVSGISGSVPRGVAALDHEIRNDTMKYRSVVKGNALFRNVSRWALPFPSSVCQSDEIHDRCWGFLLEQLATQGSRRGIENSRWFARGGTCACCR